MSHLVGGQIVQGAASSRPWRWERTVEAYEASLKKLVKAGMDPKEAAERLEIFRLNGEEPSSQLFGDAEINQKVVYPGLPSLEGLTPNQLVRALRKTPRRKLQ
jgi:hypothetical protein